jgi:hypothetical protein
MSTQDPAEMIHLVSRRADCAQVRLGDCETVVTLRVSTDEDGAVRLVQSHWIRTPDEGRASRPQSVVGLTPKHALGAAIGELAMAFSRGLRQGHRPDESWFVPAPILSAV